MSHLPTSLLKELEAYIKEVVKEEVERQLTKNVQASASQALTTSNNIAVSNNNLLHARTILNRVMQKPTKNP